MARSATAGREQGGGAAVARSATAVRHAVLQCREAALALHYAVRREAARVAPKARLIGKHPNLKLNVRRGGDGSRPRGPCFAKI